MKRVLSLTLALLLAVSLFAACSDGSGGSQGGSGGAGGESGAQGSQDPQGSGGGPGTLVVAIDSDVATMHPTDHTTSNEMDLNHQIYDTLYRITLDGSTPPEPRIATAYEISEDGLTYTFTLRQDVTFHDGSPLTAEDVKFTAELYQQSLYQSAKVEGLASVEVVDPYTVAFTTSSPYSPFLENIMDMNVASKAYYESAGADAFAASPVGSGPYRVVSHELGNKIELEAYEGYYLGEAAIKKVTMRVLGDETTLAVALQAGDVDFAQIREANFANLNGVDGIVVEEAPSSRFGFVSLNHEKYPFSEVKFRQAVAYAMNRQNMIDLALDGLGTVNSSPLSPLRFGYSDSQPRYDYNPDRTRELLEELGIETPYDLGVMYVAEAYSTQAQVVQNDLRNVGLEVTLEILEFNAYLDKLMNGDCGVTFTAMTLEGSTQEYALAFKSDYVGGANNVRYRSDEIDALFDRAIEAVDEDERFRIYDEIFTKVQEEAVYITIYNAVILYAHRSDLTCHPFALEGRYYIYDFSF